LVKENKIPTEEILEERGIKKLAFRAYEILTEGVTSLEEVYPLLSGF
jgi:hypothetical protein